MGYILIVNQNMFLCMPSLKMQKKTSILGGRSPPIKAKPDGLDPLNGFYLVLK